MSYSSILHELTDAYKVSIFYGLDERTDAYKVSLFYGLVASPTFVVNIAVYFLLLYSSSLSVSTKIPFYVILDYVLPAPQFRPGIWCWWISVLFNSTMLFIIILSSVLFCFYRIATANDTVSPSSALVDSLDLCGGIISSLN